MIAGIEVLQAMDRRKLISGPIIDMAISIDGEGVVRINVTALASREQRVVVDTAAIVEALAGEAWDAGISSE